MLGPDLLPAGDRFPRVLVVEDDSVMRRLLQHWLQSWGFEVALAGDGAEALRVLEQQPSPKLILTDWLMPGMDGIELCRQLRSRPAYYRYILMITSRTEVEHIAHALDSGADDCITKPFKEHELRARVGVASRILALQDELIEAREELRMQAMKDSLTGLWNRSAFKELFELELDRAARSGDHTGLLLLDLDHFKHINDAYGHMTGDVVLRKAARLLKKTVRSYDFVGRFGGEEFLIAFPACDERQLRTFAERVRHTIEQNPIRIGDTEIPITFSIGAALAPPTERSMVNVMTVADVALYRAKQSGRNRSIFCGREPSSIAASNEAPQVICASCKQALAMGCVSCAGSGTLPKA